MIKTKKKSTKEEATPALVPKLRFKEFRCTEGWKMTPLGKWLNYQQPTPYLVNDDRYNPAFKTPVLTAGKTFILGYTNEEHGIFSDDLPVIIFDDFTTATQFVDFPFKAKSSAMKILQASNGADIKFMYEALQTVRFEVGAHERHWISTFAPMLVPIPKANEQKKIANCLRSVDESLIAQASKVKALKTHKKGLMEQLFPREGETQPRLRFPDFQNAGDWEECTVEGLISTIPPPKKLQTADYQPEGKFPIVDQSQNQICGWTDDHDAVIAEQLPVIVFGDHTCALKFIDHPFVQGADGIKIFQPKRGIDVRFMFCALEANPVVQENYKRHFSMLKEKKLSFPDPKTGEQQRISSCLSSLEPVINFW